MPQQDWSQTQHRLTEALSGLEDSQTLIVSEPDPPGQGEKKGLFRKRTVVPVRYVQFNLTGPEITAECVGGTAWGGTWEISPDQDAAVRQLGWVGSDVLVAQKIHTAGNYQLVAPQSEAPRLAEISVAALEILGLGPADEMDWQVF